MKELNITGAEGLKLYTYLYDSVKKPSAVMLIIHGMQEHAARYETFANFLNKNNVVVVTSDLRGHGKTSGEIQGYDKGDIFALTLQDQQILLNEIRTRYANLPVFILGHSYGSFLSQSMLLGNPNVDGIVLSGSAYSASATMKSAKIIAAICGIGNTKRNATFIENMSLKSYGKKFEEGNWLSRDNAVWQKYTADKFCGKTFPVSFYKSFFGHIVNNYKGLENVNKNIPLLLIGGTNDPVSNYGKGLVDLYEKYKNAGLNVELKQYKDARHEVLNETNKDEVFADVLKFITANLKPAKK